MDNGLGEGGWAGGGLRHPGAAEEGSALGPRGSVEVRKEPLGLQCGDGMAGPLSLSPGNFQ